MSSGVKKHAFFCPTVKKKTDIKPVKPDKIKCSTSPTNGMQNSKLLHTFKVGGDWYFLKRLNPLHVFTCPKSGT